ncbi:MAG: hypothetical protein HY649_01625 [Acidobacteria bacterium]|nr:hypothetical protein [Acidobacteriota bacterium]
MSYLPTIDDEQADGKLKEVYAEIRRGRNLTRVSPVLQAFSMRPEVLDSVQRLSNQATFGGSSLGRRWEEMLSVAVSTWNHCHY